MSTQCLTRRQWHALYVALRKFVASRVHGEELIDDVVHDTLERALRYDAAFRADASLQTWVFAIARRQLADTFRAYLHRSETNDSQLDVDRCAAVDGWSLVEGLGFSEALARLEPKKRQAFVLVAIHGYTAQEAATMLDVPANTVASRYRHARQTLAELLGGLATNLVAPPVGNTGA